MDYIDRRSFLGAVSTGATLGVSGCLDGAVGRPEGVVLSPPENYEMLSNAELPHPIYGEEFPDVTVHDPLNDEDVSTGDYEGDRHVLLTLFFSRCTQTCPTLVSNLVQVQAEAAAGGWSDEVMLIAVTFDPEHDTEPVLREYADEMGVDLESGNFRFLRPDDQEHARAVVEEGFGGVFQRNRIEEHSHDDGGNTSHDEANTTQMDDVSGSTEDLDGNGSTDGNTSTEGDGTGDGDDEQSDVPEGQEYVHSDLTLFGNKGGVVERAYTPNPPAAPTVVDDVSTVVEEYSE